MAKSSVEQIRARFDQDVERFSNLETGQSATIDAPIALELIAKAAHACCPHAKRLLDVGCGAGNFALRVLGEGDYREVTLCDLSQPMLERAQQRVGSEFQIVPTVHQTDIRELNLPSQAFDVVVAGAVLHHLRTPDEWQATFERIFQSIAPGGSFWIFDLVTNHSPGIARIQKQRYGQYLTNLKDEAYRDHVFEYIEQEDSPAPLSYQLQLLHEVGFDAVEVLHFNTCFAAFGGIKSTES